jgi:integrase
LKWQDVDFDKDRVNVYASKTKDWRTIPISPEFRSRLLSKQKEARTEFVIEYQGKPMKKFRRSFQTACKRAGIEYPCRMYDTRHLFASVMLSGGADLAAVSKLLGHSSTQMTANVYYEVLQGEKQKAIALLPPLFNSDENEKASKVVPFKALG